MASSPEWKTRHRLESCWKLDIDWSLYPTTLKEVSSSNCVAQTPLYDYKGRGILHSTSVIGDLHFVDPTASVCFCFYIIIGM